MIAMTVPLDPSHHWMWKIASDVAQFLGSPSSY